MSPKQFPPMIDDSPTVVSPGSGQMTEQPKPETPSAPQTVAAEPEIFSHAQFIVPHQMVNAPPDKHFLWVSQRALDKGQFQMPGREGWMEYTKSMLESDARVYGTRLATQPNYEGERIWIGLHWPVWMPKSRWIELQNQRINRHNAYAQNKSVNVSPGHEDRVRYEENKGGRIVSG